MINDWGKPSSSEILVETPGNCVAQCPPYQWLIRHEGRLLPATNLFDVYGDETNDPRRADRAVAFEAPGKWHMFTGCVLEEFVRKDRQ